jgi:hypothetical protein
MADVLVRAVGGQSVARVLSRQALGEEPTVVAPSPAATGPEPLLTPRPQPVPVLPETRQSLPTATTTGASVQIAVAQPATPPPARKLALPALVLGGALLVGLVAGGIGFVASRQGGPATTVNQTSALAGDRPAVSSAESKDANEKPRALEPSAAPSGSEPSSVRSAAATASPAKPPPPATPPPTTVATVAKPPTSPAVSTTAKSTATSGKPKPKPKADDEAIE